MTFMIDVVSDVVCPWCYIGKRRLAVALARLHADDPAFEARVNWHPFQLNPELPAAGVDRKRYLEAKFGGPARAREIYAPMDSEVLMEWADSIDKGLDVYIEYGLPS